MRFTIPFVKTKRCQKGGNEEKDQTNRVFNHAVAVGEAVQVAKEDELDPAKTRRRKLNQQ